MRLTTARFKHGVKSRVSPEAPSVKGFAWIVSRLAAGRDVADQVELRHEGSCGRCGRKLTTPESIDTGLGPVCAEALGIDWGKLEQGEVPFDALRYLTAGRATLTATSHKTGASFTYQVSMAEPREGDTHRLFFVKVLQGPNNEADYGYLGTLWVGGAEPFQGEGPTDMDTAAVAA